MHNYNISAGFVRSSIERPDGLFYQDDNDAITYGEMATLVARLAAHFSPADRPRRVGILGSRSMEAYAGILAAGFAGATYVPLSLKWPENRLVVMLRGLELDGLVADARGAEMLTPAVLDAAPDRIVVSDRAGSLSPRAGQSLAALGSVDCAPMCGPVPIGPSEMAYIVFTSGSTGMPKGVQISAGALRSYLDSAHAWTCLNPDDRVAEACDITFDLSVHNLFLAAEAGSSLHILSPLDMLAPARFIRARQVTTWLSVPTLATMMRRSGALKPGIFPSLRLSMFCGEPLPAPVARAWAAATPNGVVENIYGPSEATVVCTRQRIAEPLCLTPSRDVVAIGRPFETMDVAILDTDLRPVPDGQPGEIALSGPQLADGYLDDPQQTSERFRIIDGRRWYLTGDLAMRDSDGVLHHLGRTDNQVKVKGNRIELEEVEMHLRQAAGTDAVAVVAWPVLDGTAQGLVGFCLGDTSPEAIAARMTQTLPQYMVPDPIHVVDNLPVNINGKVDRRALTTWLDAGLRDSDIAAQCGRIQALSGASA